MDLFYLIPVAGLALPFVLWPIELLLPYPYVVEEIAKGLLVLQLISYARDKNVVYATSILTAFLFSLTENVLYLVNILQFGTATTFILRFLTATPMHIATMLVITYFGLRHKKLIVAGVLLAIFIHYIYNLLGKFLLVV